MSSTTCRVRSRPSASHIFLRYVLFAIIAGIGNLAAQDMTVQTLPQLPLMLPILVGTGVGFVLKYVLDKKWIFCDAFDVNSQEVQKIAKYGFFSVATTMLFWATELLFWHVAQTTTAKYAGAVLGLGAGNWIKYQLDKAYVFKQAER
jgi:putative flippase GtrA